MRMSQLFAPTLREVPSDAEITSHQLMLRSGMIRKSISGIYTYLPLGYKVIRKVEDIIREEMDRAGGQELLMSALQSSEIWKESNRWDAYGNEMFKLKDRGLRDLCLGPTHEEMITVSVRDEVRSYRQLPKLLYQIQTKYRDEIRPRFGLMRAREFIMKDLYSFDQDQAGLDTSYMKMYDAYCRAFDRCGLNYKIVEADCGTIGGTSSHEYMVVSDIGEAGIVCCNECNYGANLERAEVKYNPLNENKCALTEPEMSEIATPNVRTIEQLSEFFGCDKSRMLKTLIYTADATSVAVVIRGDRTLNEVKLKSYLKCDELELASEDIILSVTKAPIGFAGPVGLSGIRIIGDLEIVDVPSGITGANKLDAHFTNVVYGRDYSLKEIADLREAVDGDLCPSCGKPLYLARGIEVGHLFKLGTKYSKSLGATFLNEEGEEHPMIMGCYGIGVTRVVASIIESSYDQDGIIWPMSVAPYKVVVVCVNTTDENQLRISNEIYEKLKASGAEVLLDDRDERPGVKFKDADLIGTPIRITVGRAIEEGQVEIKQRRSKEVTKVSFEEIYDHIKGLIDSEMSNLQPKNIYI